jgi:hypothetical protein
MEILFEHQPFFIGKSNFINASEMMNATNYASFKR